MLDIAEKEKELRQVMLGAQRITEDMKTNARKEADLIISEAELKAERIVADSERQLGELKARIEDVRRFKKTMKVLRMIGEQKTIVGFDVVEFAPNKTVQHPDYTAAKLTYKLMNYAWLSKQ